MDDLEEHIDALHKMYKSIGGKLEKEELLNAEFPNLFHSKDFDTPH